MTRAIVLLRRNGDGSETVAGVFQVSGDQTQSAGGVAIPGGDRWFNYPATYAEGLAHAAREPGDHGRGRLEDWVPSIIDELDELDSMRALEVAPAATVSQLYDREITLHPPEGFLSANDDESAAPPIDPTQAEDQAEASSGTGLTRTGTSGATAAASAKAVNWWAALLEESRGRAATPSRVTILLPPARPESRDRRSDADNRDREDDDAEGGAGGHRDVELVDPRDSGQGDGR